MPNRLANETSPYLLQHKDNPVDWYPWGEEAFEKARTEDKPIFLSVGYSACHWCHVMEHESFEDEATAAYLNDHFVSIKVDREERPDVDSIYMSVVVALTRHGGWPMSVWMLPDGRPFYGGTYFPNLPRQGMLSFMQILQRLHEVYQNQRDALERDASNITQAVQTRLQLETESGDRVETDDVFQTALQALANEFDQRNGGFGMQPKFPPSMTLEFLLRMHQRYDVVEARFMVERTLDRMAYGGMYDQLGGGFARYSVDAVWLVPHFEKMLYDNALLLRSYLYGYQVIEKPLYLRVIDETLEYIAREMTSPEGGFYSSQDADSEGEEGKFFVWRKDELLSLLPDDVNQDLLVDYWGLKHGPNFEGNNILWVPDNPEEVVERHDVTHVELHLQVSKARAVLFEHREKRIHPGLDDKILTSWNGLMIHSLARIARALSRDDALNMAVTAAEFVLGSLYEDGRLHRTYKQGRARFNAYLEDYSFFIEALIELYQSTFDIKWYRHALTLTGTMVDLFWDDEIGFYDTSHDHENLISRPQDLQDNAIPSGTSSAVAVLLRMAILADKPDWRDKALKILARLSSPIARYPQAFAYLGSQLDFAFGEPHEVALIGKLNTEHTQELLEVVNKAFRPNQIIVLGEPESETLEEMVLLSGRTQLEEVATAYVCQNYVCQLPVNTPDALAEQLQRS